MLPTIDRTTVIKGPALVFDDQGVVYYSKNDITVAPQKGTWDLPTAIYGRQTDQRLKDIWYKISFTDAGEVTPAKLARYYSLGTAVTGSSIFGSSDRPLRIVSLTETVNNYWTFNNAAISKMPDVSLRTDASVFGAVEFSCIGSNNTAFNTANRILSITTKTTSGTVTATSNANPDVITTGATHGLAVGDPITISGVTGDTAVNVSGFVLTVPSSTTFTVSLTKGGAAIVGNGAFTGAGVWNLGWPFNSANAISSPFSGTWATSIPSGNITATSDANPDVITTATAHGLKVGDRVTIASVTGDTAVDGQFYVVAVPSATTFEISATLGGAPIAGNGVYISGGTFTRTSALDNFDTEAGINVTFDLALTPKRSNSVGTYDILFSSLTVRAKGKPIGPTPTDMLNAINAQGANTNLGQSMAGEGQNLKLNGVGIYFWLYQAFIATNPTQFSAENNRVDDVEWVATRSFTGFAANPLFKISTTPITS